MNKLLQLEASEQVAQILPSLEGIVHCPLACFVECVVKRVDITKNKLKVNGRVSILYLPI